MSEKSENLSMESYCGLLCSQCDFIASHNCGGCLVTLGQPFHGSCQVAECAKSQQIIFCGLCGDFPCALLKSYAYDSQHGDQGARIENCRKWRESRNGD